VSRAPLSAEARRFNAREFLQGLTHYQTPAAPTAGFWKDLCKIGRVQNEREVLLTALREALAVDARLNAAEEAPTGDHFNEVLAFLRSAAEYFSDDEVKS